MEQRKVSVSELIHQCNDAVSKMSADNDHKLLIFNCGYAMRQMLDTIGRLEREAKGFKVVK